MQKNQPGASDIRLAELMAALSIATDLGMGQPMEYALCVCVLAVRLGETLGLSEDELREVYYLALLRHIGCNAETYTMSALFGESIIRALGHVFERWDGRGTPAGLKGEQIAPSMRVVALAQDVITFHRLDGAGAAVAIAKERKGTVYDPRMVELFCRQAPQ